VPVEKMTLIPRTRTQRVPLSDQLGLAALPGLAVGLVVAGVLIVRHMPSGIGREIGIGVLVVCVVVGVFLLIQSGPRAWVWMLEDVRHQDIDGDGNVGEPGGDEIRFLPLRSNSVTQNDDSWSQFVRGCANDTSERRWLPVLGEATYTSWRDLLIRQGYGEWRNPDKRQGWQLTATPDEVLAACQPEGE
jgi:hypothetical protein